MDINILFSKFNAALIWNAYMYSIYKLTSTALVFLLYYRLEPELFGAWATINSIIFLILLWADLGLRKSIPRFAPEFLKNVQATQQFTFYLPIIQSILLGALTPFFVFASKNLIPKITAIYTSSFIFLLVSLFIVEGLLATARLLYHAYFKQKFFNGYLSVFLCLEAIANAACFISIINNNYLVISLFAIKLLFSSCALIFFIKNLKRTVKATQEETINTKKLYKEFAVHSMSMWGTTSIRSLTERNGMLPLLTYILGPHLANIYKVANDGALLFQRIILKTIGTADTALLSYAQMSASKKTIDEEKKLTKVAFKKLLTKVAALCLPVLGFLSLVIAWSFYTTKSPLIFYIFCIVSVSYILEVMLLPYERILEVKRAYKILFCVYGLYLCACLAIIFLLYKALIGIQTTITLLSFVRLVSLLIMSYYAYIKYKVYVPFT